METNKNHSFQPVVNHYCVRIAYGPVEPSEHYQRLQIWCRGIWFLVPYHGGGGLIWLEAMESLERWQKCILRLVSLPQGNKTHWKNTENYSAADGRAKPCQGKVDPWPMSRALEGGRNSATVITTWRTCFPMQGLVWVPTAGKLPPGMPGFW